MKYKNLKMKIWLISLSLFFLTNISFAEIDIWEDEPKQTRIVKLREFEVTKKISIFSIKTTIFLYNNVIRNAGLVYDFSTTANFQNSVANIFKTYHSILFFTSNNLLTFNHQKLFANMGYFTVNLTLGVGGTANFSKAFELNEGSIKFADVMRFYGFPEYFFGVFLVFPLSVTEALGEGLKYTEKKFILPYNIKVIEGSTPIFWLGFLNQFGSKDARMLLDTFAKLPPQTIYDILKQNLYGEAVNFEINRNLFKTNKRPLKEKFTNEKLKYLN